MGKLRLERELWKEFLVRKEGKELVAALEEAEPWFVWALLVWAAGGVGSFRALLDMDVGFVGLGCI